MERWQCGLRWTIYISEDFLNLKSSRLSAFLVMGSMSCAASLQPKLFAGVYQVPEPALGELSIVHRLQGYEFSSAVLVS